MKKVLTLVIIQKDGKILLGKKKRDFAEGKWNGFGGKVHEGETIEDAARREVKEEAGIEVLEIEKVGIMEFEYKALDKIMRVHVFKAVDFVGEPVETEEMIPRWFGIEELPFDSMWPNDEYWYPLFLDNKKFECEFFFDESYKIVKYDLREVENFSE